MNPRKLLARFQFNQANIRFGDLTRLAIALGFIHDRTTGSHRVFIHPNHPEAQLTLQPVFR